MKNIVPLLALAFIIQFTGCKSDSESSQLEKNKSMLTAVTWSKPVVAHGTDGDLSDDYTDFVITFTNDASAGFEGLFVISNGSHAFTESAGHWKFSDDSSKIIFDSGKEMDFQLTENHLRLDFIVSDSGGRVNGLSGHFTFDLQPL